MSAELGVLNKIRPHKDFYGIHKDDFNSNRSIDISRVFDKTPNIGDSTVDIHDIFEDGSCLATYQFNGDVTDLGGNYDGTNTNIIFEDGVYNESSKFSGNSYSDLGFNLNTKSFSISMWVYQSNNAYILGNVQSSASDYGIILYSRDGFIQMRFFNSSGTYSSLDIICNNNSWNHITYTYNRDSHIIKGYLDGILFDSTINLHLIDISATYNLRLGGFPNPHSSGFIGNVDQFRAFNRVLTELEIKKLYYEQPQKKIVMDIEMPQEYISTVSNVDPFDDDSGVALYQFDGDALDTGGNYHGTNSGVTFESGKYNQCGVFNGSNSYISSITTNQQVYCVSCYININDFSDSGIYNTLSDFSEYSTSGILLALDSSSQSIVGLCRDGTNSSTVSFSANIDKYYFIVLQVDYKTVSLYIDGNLVDTHINANDFIIAQKNTQIGVYGISGVSYHFNGKIDQLRIFNRALDEKEINILYNERVLR